MKSSLIKSTLVENPGLPERLAAESVVRFVRGLWRQAKAFHGGAPQLFSVTIETAGWSAAAKRGAAPPYYAGGAASVRGTLAIIETNLSAIIERQGGLADPRTIEALGLIRGVLAGTPRTGLGVEPRSCASAFCKAQALPMKHFCEECQAIEDKQNGGAS